MRSLHRQRGLSTIGWLALLIVVGFATVVAVRIVPVYLDYYAVLSSARAVQSEGTRDDLSVSEMREALRRQMQVNDVDDLGDAVSVQRNRGRVEMTVDYEVREPLFGNIDVVLTFNRRIGT